ncbi:alpha-amylase family glycosyl hydrolase [Robertkochia sediminum]|uniref:alpha-amylase family glycosyl hydrolase n=1 Tax=Robertkochia sediminum TaxID=2785326 RepID=UPI001931AD7F|nr:alpha-amylase family glycosyl hydrolase [Robertkochia sediminum]MBL7473157.1 alpha-amylase [Robertkochia sediminum]
MNFKYLTLALLTALQLSCKSEQKEQPEMIAQETPFMWEASNVYFMLTDRFNNGDTTNDTNFDRNLKTGPARGFEGGDLKGIIQKLEEGYFEDLGINVLWFTPVVEQIHGIVDEGTGPTYAYHGYWAKDWTTLDPNFGTEEDLEQLIALAHSKGIRVLLDVVVNHTGPVTDKDPVYGNDWVRTGPACKYQDYESTTSCTLVENLPDVLTDKDEAVTLPKVLLEKWEQEGRLDQEVAELDTFFNETGLPRAPRFYIMKWLTDMVKAYGVDGFRVDTAKHTEASIWQELYDLAAPAFETWKQNNPEQVLDNTPFFMVGEVYNYNISAGRWFDYGDKKVDFFANGFKSLINFEFKSDARKAYEALFSKYDTLLTTALKGKSVLNYVSSHDDGGPFDPERKKPYETANKLLLTPGASQVYYGDETSRILKVRDAQGDANLRSFMNWEELANNAEIQKINDHWKKLGTFRRDHPAVGVGRHEMLSKAPYVFARSLNTTDFSESVVIGLDLQPGEKTLTVGAHFEEGSTVTDHYSGNTTTVKNGAVTLNTPFDTVLLY